MWKPDARARKMVEQKPVVDLTKCYVCTGKATAKCVTCKAPVCDDHQRETYGRYFSEAITTMCIECTMMMRHW